MNIYIYEVTVGTFSEPVLMEVKGKSQYEALRNLLEEIPKRIAGGRILEIRAKRVIIGDSILDLRGH